jgi:hypothetical protein
VRAEGSDALGYSETSKTSHGGRRYLPFAFTEQGVAMLSSVLGSERAIAVNIEIMRAFVRTRQLLSSNKELARRFAQLESRIDKKFAEHDGAITPAVSVGPPPCIRRIMQHGETRFADRRCRNLTG